MKRIVTYIAIVVSGLMLSAPALAQSEVTIQVIDNPVAPSGANEIKISDDADPQGATASQFGREVAGDAKALGRDFGLGVAGTATGDAKALGDELNSDFGSGLNSDNRELPDRSLNLDIPSPP